MAECQVNNMDVISYTCAVVGVIVTAVNTKARSFADSNLCDIGHKVVGYTIGVFTDTATLMCADGVEVTKK